MVDKEPKERKEELTPAKKTVTIGEDQLSALLQRIANLEAGNKVELKPKRVTERMATLRFYQDKAVVGISNAYELPDTQGRRVLHVGLTLDGQDEPVVLTHRQFLDFLNGGNGEKVEIVSQKATEHVKTAGTVRAQNPDPVNVKTWDGGMVDLEVVTITYQAEVVVVEGAHKGDKFSVPTSVLNA